MADPDLESFSVEDLDAMMTGEKPIPGSEPPPPAPVPPETDIPIPTLVPTPEPQPVDPEPEPATLDQQIVDARLAEFEAKAKHWEQIAGKNGGELGFLRNQLAELQAAIKARQSDGYDPEPTAVVVQPQRDSVVEWAIQTAREQALARFAQEHPDAHELGAAMNDYMVKSKYQPPPLYDPGAASDEATRALREAYHFANAERKARVVQELTTKRADQMRGLTEAKKQASISASGSTPPERPQPKTYDEMSSEELDAELRRLTGERTKGRMR